MQIQKLPGYDICVLGVLVKKFCTIQWIKAHWNYVMVKKLFDALQWKISTLNMDYIKYGVATVSIEVVDLEATRLWHMCIGCIGEKVGIVATVSIEDVDSIEDVNSEVTYVYWVYWWKSSAQFNKVRLIESMSWWRNCLILYNEKYSTSVMGDRMHEMNDTRENSTVAMQCWVWQDILSWGCYIYMPTH